VPPPPAARDKVLDAFERLLVEHGERETTLDAVARAAGVSKGGLIYHFGSREALIDGLLGRLEQLADEDLVQMAAAAEGPVAYYVRTSADTDTPLDLTLIAATRLLQRSHSRTREVLAAGDVLDLPAEKPEDIDDLLRLIEQLIRGRVADPG
jgi:AcrR family transcriptional regulator